MADINFFEEQKKNHSLLNWSDENDNDEEDNGDEEDY